MPARRLVLASASPARLALLRTAGLAPEVVVSGVIEDGVDGLDAAATARLLAERKATAVAERLGRVPAGVATDTGGRDGSGGAGDGSDRPGGPGGPGGPVADPPVVIGCDSVLAFGDEVRGKPASPEEAARWWRGYRDRQGTLVSGHAVVDLATGRRHVETTATTVRFGHPTDAEIAAYVATGEPLAVAGAFTLDGYGAPFVRGIDGDHGTVLGLSLPLLRSLLADLDVAIADLWTAP